MILYGQQIEFCVEVMVVKKKVTIVLGIISIVAISTMIMFSIRRIFVLEKKTSFLKN